MTPRILAFAGSLRAGSYNKQLVKVGAEGARKAGAEVTYIDLRDYPLPIFDEDLEKSEGLPPNGRKLKDLFLAHQGLLLSCPEYNSSITAVLKNTIDWVSRPCIQPDGKPEPPLGCFDKKVVGLLAASGGALGGIRGLVEVRRILGNIKCLVLPEQFSLVKAQEALDDHGNLKDAKQREQAETIGKRVAEVAARLNG